MAKEWTVTPSEGVINNNDGTFSFPANETYCAIDYEIVYKDTDQGCQCKNIYNQEGLPCLDDNHYGTGTDGTLHYVDECGGDIEVSASVPYTSYTHYVSDDCKSCLDGPTVYTSYTASATVTFGENYGSAESDTGITESDTGGYIKYSYYQYGDCTPPCCDDEITASGENYISGGTEGSGRIGTCGYLKTTCSKGTFTVSNVSSDASWLSGESFNSDDNTFEAYCEKNTTGSDRTAHLTATATCGGKTYPLSWSSTQCCCCGD